MKKALKITGISLVAIIGLLIAAPFLFKDKLVQLVKEQANANLNAKVDFGDFDLTLFSSFPDFRFKINNVSVINVAPFEGDTLAYIKQLSFDLNLMSVISGDKYQINSLILDEPKIKATVLADGRASYDIAKADTTKPETPADTSATKFALKLKEMQINHAHIVYNDIQGSMYAKLVDLNYNLQGDFTQDNFVLSNLLEIAETNFSMSGVGYLSKVKTRFKADIDMNMTSMKFAFKENELNLNDLGLAFDGFVAMPKEDVDMDLKFATKQTEFKSILSLIPSVYSKDFATVQTKGKLTLNGLAKGTMHTSKDGKSDKYPSFEINLGIANAMFKYPSLPQAVNDINVDIHVENKKDYLDATTVDVNKFHVNMAGNPVDVWAHVKTPISDPDLAAEIKGVINLASVKEFIPLEKGDNMSGVVKADIVAAGRMSSIDKKEYDKFKMSGSVEIDKMNYKTTTLPYEVILNVVKLNFTNQFVELAAFDALMGKSDIKAQGKIENFMQYIFKDSLIKGNFNVQSNLFDVKELMGSTATTTASTKADTAASSTRLHAVTARINCSPLFADKILPCTNNTSRPKICRKSCTSVPLTVSKCRASTSLSHCARAASDIDDCESAAGAARMPIGELASEAGCGGSLAQVVFKNSFADSGGGLTASGFAGRTGVNACVRFNGSFTAATTFKRVVAVKFGSDCICVSDAAGIAFTKPKRIKLRNDSSVSVAPVKRGSVTHCLNVRRLSMT